MDNSKGIEFLKNRIKEKLSLVSDQMSKYSYKIAITLVDKCTNFEELKEMAELSLQMDYFKYIRDEIDPLLNEMDMTIADIRKIDINTNEAEVKPDSFELNPSEIAEAMDDEETNDIMAAMLCNRMTTESYEEKHRQEILDFQLEDRSDIEAIDNIDMSDEELGLEDEEEELTDDDFEDDLSDAVPDEEDSSDDDYELDEEFLASLEQEYAEDNESDEDAIDDIDTDDIEVGDTDEDDYDLVDDIDTDDLEIGYDEDESESDEDDIDDIDADDLELGDDSDENDIDSIDTDDIFIDDEDETEDLDIDTAEDLDIDDIDVDDIFIDEDESESDEDAIDDIDADDLELGDDEEDVDNIFIDNIDDINVDTDEDDDIEIEDSDDDLDIEGLESDEDDYDFFGDLNDAIADSAVADVLSDKDEFEIDEDELSGFLGEDEPPVSKPKSNVKDIGVLDDSDTFFRDNAPKQVNIDTKTAPNALVHQTEKPSRASGIKPNTVYRNGTIQGEKTQKMFDMFSSFGKKSVKVASKIKEQTKNISNSKFFEIGSEFDEPIDL